MEALGQSERTWPAVRRHIVEGLEIVLGSLVLALLIRVLVVQSFYVPSDSMLPALEPGDFVLANRLVYRLHPPRRGDIIAFRYPRDERWDFVKRVIGLPGDIIEGRDGRVWVNRRPAAEPYVRHSADGSDAAEVLPPRRIPAGQLFVLGDNRDASLDSRYWGTVDMHEVIGKASLIYWSHGRHWWDIRWERIGRWLS